MYLQKIKAKIAGFLGYFAKNTLNNISINLQEAQQLFQNVPVEIAIYDLDGKYKFVNQLYAVDDDLRKSIIGKKDEFYFKSVGIDIECLKKRKEHFLSVVEEKKAVRFTEKLVIPKKNKTYYYKRYYQPIFVNGDGKRISGICLFGSDLTAVIHGQQELKYLAYHDKLTGLKNRDGFYEQLDQIILDLTRSSEEKVTAILFCDLDNFKLVNDSLGHDIGDLVLKEVAGRLTASLRKTDFVYRLGGDEFTVIIRHLKREYEASRVAEKIIKNVSKPYKIKNNKINYLSTSIGIVVLPKKGGDRETLVKNADAAMYDAKNQGKNRYQFFNFNLTENSNIRLNVENNMQTMVKDRTYDKECKILYQPIIEKKKNGDYKIIGSEALLRWSNPQLGHMLPDSFIPIAEETNLITPMGEWVLHKSCSDIIPLINKYDPSFFISINLSVRQLKSNNIVKKVQEIIDIVRINPKNIQLELTETSYLDNQTEVLQNINALKQLGVQLAIDDFGIGFASFSYLQKVPASTIKIDRSFIKNLGNSDKHNQLVKSIINLGKNLKKEVIAEGVEEHEHLDILNAQDCFKYQGFLFSKPINIKKLESLIQDKLPPQY